MNPLNNESIQLPPPAVEQAPAGNGQTEQAPAGPETNNLPASPPATSPADQTVPLPTQLIPTDPAPQTGAASTTLNTSLQIKDDGDLIEKEWVNKAKQIVERNRDDPYKQSEELTVFKADYMKKRYNKTIKLNK
jgi:hypothetical protein